VLTGREARTGSILFALSIALILAAFTFLHLYRIASISPTWDEGTDIAIVQCLNATHDPFACLDDISQTRLPFYIHAAVLALTTRIEAQYVVSFVASALTLLLLCWFARREFGVAVATMTAALYVTSPQLLASGRMLMTHSNILFTLFTTISFIAFYYAVEARRRLAFYGGEDAAEPAGGTPAFHPPTQDAGGTPASSPAGQAASRRLTFAIATLSAIAFGLATSCSILGVFNGIFIIVFYSMTIVRERRARWLDLTFLPIAVATFFATSIIYLKPANFDALIRACRLPDVYPFWNYLNLGSPHAPWYFSLVVFVIKIGPWWIASCAVCAFFGSSASSTQRAFLSAFAIALAINFALKGFVFHYDAPHHQVQFYPLVYLAIAAVCLGSRRRARAPLIAAIGVCFAIQIYDVVRFFPNYLFYGSQYGDRFIGEFYGPAVMHAQDRGPVNAYINALLARDPGVKILVEDHNALERPEPNFVPFTKRDPAARYDYVFADRLFTQHFRFPERDAFNQYVAANYVDDYTYDFPVHVWMYKVMKKK
jgi:4-amino-4-deoxy-L-arabinose transferase-like glycosyltransferase